MPKEKHPRAVFHCKGGYDGQQERAKKFLTVGKRYVIQDAKVGTYSSEVKVEGEWHNSTLFGISAHRLLKYFPDSFGYHIRKP